MRHKGAFGGVVGVFLLTTILSGCATVRDDIASVSMSPEAQYERGREFARGPEGEEQFDQAAQWYGRAARRGHVDAQYQYGMALYTGRGVPRDQAQGVEWLEKAATAGNLSAQYFLGDAFAFGRGVTVDSAWAARWYAIAAAQGHPRSQFMLGVAYSAGVGVPEDTVAAWQWLALSKEGNHTPAAEALSNLSPRLTADERARAERAVGDWTPTDDRTATDTATLTFVQYRLNALGYAAGPVDGLPGPRTDAALRAFASAEGLASDSISTPDVPDAVLARLRSTRP